MPLNIAATIEGVSTIVKVLEAAIEAKEHVVTSPQGILNAPQLINAVGALKTAVTNLQGQAALNKTSDLLDQVNVIKQKIAAAKLLGQDASQFEADLKTLLAPAAPAPAPTPAQVPTPSPAADPKAQAPATPPATTK